MFLSIIVLTYNQEKYISKTLESILSQKHNYPYEIIIGEDCSTDGTRKIIEQYASKYPDTIQPIYNNPNLGLLKNYYNVISHCSGKYIMECAGDDYWLPGKVTLQMDFMEKNPKIGMCYGNVLFINGKNNTIIKKENGNKESFEELIKGNCIPTPTVCFKKEILDEYIKEIKPLEKKWLMEDYPMWLYFSHKAQIKHLENNLAVYRVMTDSASHSENDDRNIRFAVSVNDIQCYFANKYQIPIIHKNNNCVAFEYYYNKHNRIECKKIDWTNFPFKYKIRAFCSQFKVTWGLLHKIESILKHFK